VTKFFAHSVVDVHAQVAHAGDEVVQISPDQGQSHQLHEPAGHKADADVESRW